MMPEPANPPEFVAADAVGADAEILAVGVWGDLTCPPGSGADLDTRYLERCGFEGRPGQAQSLPADDGSTVVALGLGDPDALDTSTLRRAGATLARHTGTASVVATTLALASDRCGAAAAVVEGIGLGAYRFAGFKRQSPESALRRVSVVGAAPEDVARAAEAVAATWQARDWVNRPARALTPNRLAVETAALAADVGVRIEVWDEHRIAAEALGGLAGVAAGSGEPPRLIRLAYQPAAARRTVALVGKGITFDSGGLSLKPAGSMMTMKSDMGGAAAVICALLSAARLQLPVALTGWVAATENMPSGTAIHPGDVLTARNGTTMEVLNTDAEGRLVLADALSLAAEEEPDAIVDVATLTGGQRVALGDGVAAVLGNDDDLVAAVIDAGERAGEPAWRLPLVAAYRTQLDSEVADLRNVAAGPGASTIMAALFLQEFVGDVPWAHLDIAAPSFVDRDDGWLTKGATGWGARTLLELAGALA